MDRASEARWAAKVRTLRDQSWTDHKEKGLVRTFDDFVDAISAMLLQAGKGEEVVRLDDERGLRGAALWDRVREGPVLFPSDLLESLFDGELPPLFRWGEEVPDRAALRRLSGEQIRAKCRQQREQALRQREKLEKQREKHHSLRERMEGAQ